MTGARHPARRPRTAARLTGAMFIMAIHHVAPLDRIDEALPAHRDWLDEHYRSGVFLASGPLEPRTGGIVLVAGPTLAEVEQIAATDPLALQGLSTHVVTEFRPVRFGGCLDQDAVRDALA